MTDRAIARKHHQEHVGKHLTREHHLDIPNPGTPAARAARNARTAWSACAAAATGAFFALGLLGAAGAAAAENYSAWAHTGDLTLDTSPAGADVQGAVKDFPILVRLNAVNFAFAEARGQGQDVRFSNPDGSPLAYQIERWDSARAVAEIWVRIGSIAGATAGQTYRMHWGNPAAADSSSGPAVFAGHLAVWHMGGTGSAARLNSVAPGEKAAQPFNFTGERTREGIVGRADELDGVDDYLYIGEGYQMTTGFSFSVWAYPTAVKNYARFFDIGNGANIENVFFSRNALTNTLQFDNVNSGTSSVRAEAAIALNQWQHFAVSVSGTAVRIFKNGALVAQGMLSTPMASVARGANFLGRSNWSGDATFQGMFDEPAFSLAARSDDWFKLSYRNQKPDQKLVTLKTANPCVARFQAPADTLVDEGSLVNLAGIADCAVGVSWTALSGPAPRILDPETRTLAVAVPRVAGDTVIVYRFAAAYADSAPYRDVRVRIREAVPEPAFTLPAGLAWNGREAFAFRPAIANLAAIKASKDSVLVWSWTLGGPETDTSWLKDGITLKSAAAEGTLEVGLCLANSGPPVCRTAGITVSRTAGPVTSIATRDARGVREAKAGAGAGAEARGFRDASGRFRSGTPSTLFGTTAKPRR